MTHDAEYLLMCLLEICISSLEEYIEPCPFSHIVFVFCCQTVSVLSERRFLSRYMIHKYSVYCLFILLIVFFDAHIFFNLLSFNWKIIALQYCIDFCYTSTWISLRHTYIYSLWALPPTPSHASRLSQSTGLSSLSHTGNSHRLSVLQMIVYMFPSYSLHSSHLLLSPPCP